MDLQRTNGNDKRFCPLPLRLDSWLMVLFTPQMNNTAQLYNHSVRSLRIPLGQLIGANLSWEAYNCFIKGVTIVTSSDSVNVYSCYVCKTNIWIWLLTSAATSFLLSHMHWSRGTSNSQSFAGASLLIWGHRKVLIYNKYKHASVHKYNSSLLKSSHNNFIKMQQ